MLSTAVNGAWLSAVAMVSHGRHMVSHGSRSSIVVLSVAGKSANGQFLSRFESRCASAMPWSCSLSWSTSHLMWPPAVRTAGVATPAAAQRVRVLRSMPRARAAAPVGTRRRSNVSLIGSWSHFSYPGRHACTEPITCNVCTVQVSLTDGVRIVCTAQPEGVTTMMMFVGVRRLATDGAVVDLTGPTR